MNGDIIRFCIDLNVRETNYHAISEGGLHGPGIKMMTCITTIFSAINTTWKQISVEIKWFKYTRNCHHSLPSGLTEIYCQVVLIFESSTAVRIMTSSLSKPQTFLPIYYIKQAVLYGVLSSRH